MNGIEPSCNQLTFLLLIRQRVYILIIFCSTMDNDA